MAGSGPMVRQASWLKKYVVKAPISWVIQSRECRKGSGQDIVLQKRVTVNRKFCQRAGSNKGEEINTWRSNGQKLPRGWLPPLNLQSSGDVQVQTDS